MPRCEVGKPETLTQSIELLVARLKPCGINGECFWRGANLDGDKAERLGRD